MIFLDLLKFFFTLSFRHICNVNPVIWKALQIVKSWYCTVLDYSRDPDCSVMAASMSKSQIYVQIHVLFTGCRHFKPVVPQQWNRYISFIQWVVVSFFIAAHIDWSPDNCIKFECTVWVDLWTGCCRNIGEPWRSAWLPFQCPPPWKTPGSEYGRATITSTTTTARRRRTTSWTTTTTCTTITTTGTSWTPRRSASRRSSSTSASACRPRPARPTRRPWPTATPTTTSPRPGRRTFNTDSRPRAVTGRGCRPGRLCQRLPVEVGTNNFPHTQVWYTLDWRSSLQFN